MDIQEISREFQPDNKRAIFELVSTLFELVLGIFLTYFFLDISFPLFFLFLILSSFFLVRIFIIQHDCGHYSFFSSKKANDVLGKILSIFTLTPYTYWKDGHSKHHAYVGSLDKRLEGGYVWGYYWTLTVEEYKTLGFGKKFLYVLYHYPLFLVFFLPVLNFLLVYRLPFGKYLTKNDRKSMLFNTLFSFSFYCFIGVLLGIGFFLKIIFPIFIITAILGSWLFMIQHNYKDAYWERKENYNFQMAAVQGSSFYLLPDWLHYLTGNIGYHHIHHLLSKVPNYSLPSCYRQNKCFHKKGLKISESFDTPNLCLWDEKNKELVGLQDFRYVTITLYIGFLLLSFLGGYLDVTQVIFILIFLLFGVGLFPVVFRRNAIKSTILLTLCGINYLYFYFIGNNIFEIGFIGYSFGGVLVSLFFLFYFSKYLFSFISRMGERSPILGALLTIIRGIKNSL